MSLPFYRRSRIKTKHTNHLGNFLAARCWGQEWLQIWVKQMAGQCYECRKNCLCSGSLSCMPTALFESKVKPCCKKQNCDLNCCLSVVTQGRQQSWQQIKQTPQSGWGKKVPRNMGIMRGMEFDQVPSSLLNQSQIFSSCIPHFHNRLICTTPSLAICE